MKWDWRTKAADGTPVRYAYFQDERVATTVTDYNGKRVTVHEEGGGEHGNAVLAEATPCKVRGSGRHWLVKICTPGHKYGFVTRPTKDQAIWVMLNERERWQGRSMG